MGNITNFVRYGLQSTTPGMSYGMIDNLTLTHNGNQLTKVTDNGNDGLYYGDEEYQVNKVNSGNCRAYDANGNSRYDTNSDIWGIRYNLLNLPDSIQFYQGHQTFYTYSATGTKLQVVDKTAPDGVTIPVTNLDTVLTNPLVLSTITTDYVGDAIYRNDTLLRILLPTGYYQGGVYYYYLKDHLGSNRVVLNSSGTVVESSDYYPSGMRFGESVVNGGNVQPYRHTGMEMQGMHGLNWIDNKARMRTVNVPEFTTMDPLAEKYYSISPYAYCADNPIRLIDLNGKDWVMDNKTKKYTWQDNVTKSGNTPKGYTYVGHEHNDILKSLGVKSSYSEEKIRRSISLGGDKADPTPANSRAGAVATTLLPAAKGLIGGEKAQATILIIPLVSQGKVTDNNKSGFTFDGVGITGILTQPISNLTATGGGLEVTNGGTEYTKGPLVPANVDNNFKMVGFITTSASVSIPAINLSSGSLQSANINAGTTDNGTIWIAPVSIDFDLHDNQ